MPPFFFPPPIIGFCEPPPPPNNPPRPLPPPSWDLQGLVGLDRNPGEDPGCNHRSLEGSLVVSTYSLGVALGCTHHPWGPDTLHLPIVRLEGTTRWSMSHLCSRSYFRLLDEPILIGEDWHLVST